MKRFFLMAVASAGLVLHAGCGTFKSAINPVRVAAADCAAQELTTPLVLEAALTYYVKDPAAAAVVRAQICAGAGAYLAAATGSALPGDLATAFKIRDPFAIKVLQAVPPLSARLAALTDASGTNWPAAIRQIIDCHARTVQRWACPVESTVNPAP